MPHRNPTLTEDAFIYHLTTHLGVTPDVAILAAPQTVGLVATALDERTTGFNYLATDQIITLQRQILLARGNLPLGLQNERSFKQRYLELTSHVATEITGNEIVLAIANNRPNVPKRLQQRFERDVAHLSALLLQDECDKNSRFRDFLAKDCTAVLERTSAGDFIRTGDNLEVRMPGSHAGVVQVAPTYNDSVGRCHEASIGGWDNIAMLSSTPFNAELSRSIGQELFDLPKKQIFATQEGLAAGVKDLQQEMQRNKRLQRGFGAMVMTTVHHCDTADIEAAIDAAPDLLAPGGALVLSDLESFPEGSGSIWRMIDRARQAFHSQPHTLGVLTSENGEEGRQAVFVK